MEGSKLDKSIDEAFREILEEDGLLEPEDRPGNCPDNCNLNEDYHEKRRCECVRLAENSSRFSLRLMEAMRYLERTEPTCSSIGPEEIVGYIKANYRDDGDLGSQVRTTLRQLCSQGFVVELVEGEYHLIGPIANCHNRIPTRTDRRGQMGCGKACNKDQDSFGSENVEEGSAMEDSSPCSTCPSTESDRNGCQCGAQSFDNATGSRPTGPRRTQGVRATGSRRPIQGNRSRGPRLIQGNRSNGPRPIQGSASTRSTGSGPILRADTPANRSRGGSRREGSVRDESRSRNDRLSRSVERKSPNADLTGREDLSSETDEIYQELNARTPKRSKTRDKELKEWIKRCKRDCERKRTNK